MAEHGLIVAELKRALKESGLTYAQVAKHIGLSLPSVKRLFASGNFSLRRVDDICQFAGVELIELLERARRRPTQARRLTTAQESALIADPRLFLVTWLVLNRTAFEELVRDYQLSSREVLRYLVRLDRLKIIDLLPGNRVKVLIDPHYSWRTGGPVQEYVFHRLLREFFTSRFVGESDAFYFHGGSVSDAALARVRQLLQRAARDCMDVIERDKVIPARRASAAFVIGVRPWTYSGFDKLRRSAGSEQ